MNPDVKEQWVAALRSGEYRQGYGALHDDVGDYCCLGVLCDLAVKAGIIPVPQFNESAQLYFYGVETSVLPRPVMKWANLETDNPHFRSVDMAATSANDSAKKTFSEIADLVESDL